MQPVDRLHTTFHNLPIAFKRYSKILAENRQIYLVSIPYLHLSTMFESLYMYSYNVNLIFSERELTFTLAIIMLSPIRLSYVVCLSVCRL